MSSRIVLKFQQLFIFISFILSFFCYVSCSPPQRRVIVGENSLTKKMFYQDEVNLSKITDIIQVTLDELPGSEIGICSDGVMIIVNSETGAFRSKLESQYLGNIGAISTDKNGSIEMLNYDSLSSVVLIDKNGKPLWFCKFPESKGIEVYGMDAGDIDRDGRMDFFIAAYSGLYKLNDEGTKIWQKDGWVTDVKIFNTGKSNVSQIVTLSNNDRIQFRNNEGEMIREIKPAVAMLGMEFVQWPDKFRIVTSSGDILFFFSICVLDLDGEIFFKDRIYYSIYELRATTIKFYEDQEPYLAVLGRLSATFHRSILCIYSPDGKVFYKEIIGKTTGLLAKKSPQSKCETLLVGDGPGKVYEYKPRLKSGKLSVNEDKNTQTDQEN